LEASPSPLTILSPFFPPSSITLLDVPPLTGPYHFHEVRVEKLFLSRMVALIFFLKFKAPLLPKSGNSFGLGHHFPNLISYVGFWSMVKF
jgi:hypothetical protein